MDKTIYVLMGIPASGKSTLAREMVERFEKDTKGGVIYLSSDDIRKKKGYEHGNAKQNQEVFEQIMRHLLEDDYSEAIVDATNLSRKQRRHNYNRLKQRLPESEVVIVSIIEALDVCLKRNEQRDNPVPEDYIKQAFTTFQPPRRGVDCDTFLVKATEEAKDYLWNPWTRLDFVDDDIRHGSPHHAETIGEHINKAISIAEIENLGIEMELIAEAHDIGKYHTRERSTSQRDEDVWFERVVENKYTYYNHQNVSAMAYMAIMDRQPIKSLMTQEQHEQVLEAIYQHMNAHKGITEKQSRRNKLDNSLLELIETFRWVDEHARIKDSYVTYMYNAIKQKRKEREKKSYG